MFAFQIAAVVFIAGMGAVMVATRDAGVDEAPVDRQGQGSNAEALLSALIDRPGAWASADEPLRLGLGASNGTGLNASRLSWLLDAQDAAAANGILDVEEAVAALAAEGRHGDWHLRIRPLVGTLELESVALEGVRIAYIGAWEDIASVSLGLGTPEEMVDAARVEIDLSMASATAADRAALASLGLDFDDSVLLTSDLADLLVDLPFPLPDLPLLDHLGLTLWPGDVYPDDKDYLGAVLPGRLDQYDLLVIGSDVDGTSLTPSGVKDAIADWVDDGGGLVVLGSDDQQPQWLQPLFHVAYKSAGGSPAPSDPDHSLLTSPNALDWSAYPTTGQAWELPTNGANAAYDDFEHVLSVQLSDAWAVSHPGFAGEGRVMVSSYRIADIDSATGEGAKFLDNSVRYIAADLPAYLFLDYGPDIPDDRPVAAASATTHVWTPFGLIPVVVDLLLW